MLNHIPTPDTAATPIKELSDREVAEETLAWLRIVGEMAAQLQQIGTSGVMGTMLKSMMGGRNGQ